MHRKGSIHPAMSWVGVLFLMAGVTVVTAGTNTYWQHDPATPGEWSNDANWTGVEPTSSDGALINNGGTAEITQLGEYCSTLIVGNSSNEAGTVEMASGSLSTSTEFIGHAGRGTFRQSGGIHTVANTMYMARSTAVQSYGSYSLNGNGELLAGAIVVGEYRAASFSQNGGTNAVTGKLTVGLRQNSSGSYTLENGELSSSEAEIGVDGYGVFVQSGGLNAIGGDLYIARNSDSIGSYEFVAGTLNVGGNIEGDSGDSTLIVDGDGGTLSVAGDISVKTLAFGYHAGSNGTYALEGIKNLSAETEHIGYDGTGSFTQNGGTHTVSNTLTVATNEYSSGTYDLQGGLLTVGTLQLNSGGTLAVTGGDFDYGNLNQNGGTINGVLQNQSTFNCSAGVFNGFLVNHGAVNFNAYFTASDGLENYSSVTVNFPQTITLNGSGLTNYGTVTLTDGTLGGTGTTNAFGAQLNGRGTINTDMINNGTMTTTGLLTVTGTTVNLGQISIGSAENLRPQGGLSNSGIIDLSGGTVTTSNAVTNLPGGVIQGAGTVQAPLANNGGIIHAKNSTLNISDLSGGNVAGGELQVDGNARLHIISSFTSSGVAVLNGSTATLMGGQMTNTGTLRGQGYVTNDLINSGIIRAESGLVTLSGVISNTGQGHIEASAGSTVFCTQGLSTNAGTISLTGGLFDNNARELTNHGNIVGRGTVRSGLLDNQGIIHIADGDTDIFAEITNSNNFSITACTATFFELVTNSPSGVIVNTNGTARFLAGLVNEGQISGINATLDFGSGLLNGGQLNLNDSTVMGELYNGLGSTIAVEGTASYKGAVRGVASFYGTGTNVFESTYNPGDSPAAVSFGGDVIFTPTSTLKIEIGGLDAGDDFDVLDIAGEITFGGMLQIYLIDDFIPSEGESFAIVTYQARTGEFFPVEGLYLGYGLYLEPSYGPQSLVATAIQQFLRGDADGDSFVGADDLVTVLTYWGQSGMGQEQGDLTGDGFVGADDYVEVLTYWGSGTSPEPIPEPATLGLLILGGMICLRRGKL